MQHLDRFQPLPFWGREREGKKEWQIKSGFGHFGGGRAFGFLHSSRKANFTRIVPVSSYPHKRKDARKTAYSKHRILEDMRPFVSLVSDIWLTGELECADRLRFHGVPFRLGFVIRKVTGETV